MTIEEAIRIDREEAEHQLEQEVYAACALFEQMQIVGRAHSNGQAARQAVAQFAVEQLRHLWREENNGILGDEPSSGLIPP